MQTSDILQGQALIYCEWVNKGSKPIAMFPIQDKYQDDIERYIKEYGLYTYIEDLAEGWKTLYIYKYTFMLDIIKQLPNEPKSIYDHWVLGKAFGYSDDEIAKWINKRM